MKIGTFIFVIMLGGANIAFSKITFSPLCFLSPWDVKTCTAHITYTDGTTKEVAFQPKNKTLGTCYQFGCHPVYCQNWRDELRSSCKAEFEELMSSGQRSLFVDKNKKIASITFNGCASARYATGALALFDHLLRNLVSESYSRLCSTDSPQEEWSIKNELKELWSKLQSLNHDYLRKLTTIETPSSLRDIAR